MPIELGNRLRELRRERGYSLSQVAQQTHISRSFLGLVESGKSDITITKLMRLTRFYGLHIADILPDGNLTDSVLVRRAESQHVHSPTEGIDVLLLSKRASREMSPVIATFDPGGESEMSSHEGEEFLHVLEGRFSLTLGNDEPLILDEGDSAHFRAANPHCYKNIADRRGRIFYVVTPAIF
jgi:quercetin dioxygenase-like cupin family protein/DNA-binding XRE family transcriptional regulator